MSNLEDEVKELRAKLEELAHRAQDQAVADEFLEQNLQFRIGDFVVWRSLRRCGSVSAIGRDKYEIRMGGGEPGDGYSLDFPQADCPLDRLYTREEVEAILLRYGERMP